MAGTRMVLEGRSLLDVFLSIVYWISLPWGRAASVGLGTKPWLLPAI